MVIQNWFTRPLQTNMKNLRIISRKPPITRSLNQSPDGPEVENKDVIVETTKPYSEELAFWLAAGVSGRWSV